MFTFHQVTNTLPRRAEQVRPLNYEHIGQKTHFTAGERLSLNRQGATLHQHTPDSDDTALLVCVRLQTHTHTLPHIRINTQPTLRPRGQVQVSTGDPNVT